MEGQFITFTRGAKSRIRTQSIRLVPEQTVWENVVNNVDHYARLNIYAVTTSSTVKMSKARWADYKRTRTLPTK
jgi:hypothetical protein